MGIIDRDAAYAFMNGRPFSRSNTTVYTDSNDVVHMTLFGNHIARRCKRTQGLSAFDITNATYTTNTTKNRLNALPGVHIYQKDFQWYLNGEKWDGRWITIEDI